MRMAFARVRYNDGVSLGGVVGPPGQDALPKSRPS